MATDKTSQDLSSILVRLETQESLIDEIQRIAHIGHWDWDILNDTLYWSDEIYRIFGLEPQQFGATYEAFVGFVHIDDVTSVNNAVTNSLNDDAPYEIEHRIIQPSGEVRHVVEHGEITRDTTGAPTRMVGTVLDITDRKHYEDELKTLAFRDEGSGLYNRRFFLEELNLTVDRANREKIDIGVILIDMDHFSSVNNVHGHVVGDEVIKEVAKRIKHVFARKTDITARYGGDEFVVLTQNRDQSGLVTKCKQLVKEMQEPIECSAGPILQTVSIGLDFSCCCFGDSTNAEELIRRADTAMYKAKEAGRNTYKVTNRNGFQ